MYELLKKYKSHLLLCLLFSFSMQVAAQKSITVAGTVIDEKGESIIGVTIVVKNQPGLGTITDIDGKYRIKAGTNDVLVFSFVGYEEKEVPINSKTTLNVQMQTSSTELEEVTIVGAGSQRKASVVGAITTVDIPTLKVPSANLSNSLAGNVAGIIAMQTSGEPGENYSEFWIRGISTFGASSSALVLVDGIERNFNEVNVEDIESFSVLKDASATAIYGQRGANGVILITTKRGKEGKVNINFKGEYGIATPSRMPKYANGTQYAQLANEARLVRGEEPIYSPSEMVIIEHGLDPDIYPNVDWYDTVLKDPTSTYRAMLNISGGGSTARYFISGGYYNEEGMYKSSGMNNYNTNSDYKRYNFRSNVDVNITKSTILELGVSGWIVDRNKPGSSSDKIWGSLANLTPLTVPVRYSNGLFPTYGSGDYETNPHVLLTQTGYITTWESKLETNIALRQDLNFITKGLKFSGRFSYDAYGFNQVDRLKNPDLYRAETQRDGRTGQLILKRVQQSNPLTQSTYSWGDKRFYGELNLNYERLFAEKHRVGGLLLYYQQEYSRNDAGGNIFKAIPKRNLALSGRTTYAYKDKYMVEFNFGYTGSENFEKSKRFGFFPAIAGGYLISNEEFFQKNLPWINNLKIRYSYGEVGNDQISNKLEERFPYISTIVNGSGAIFGEQGETVLGGITTGLVGTPQLTWETAAKHNLGIDLGLFNKFMMTVEIFKDTRKDIFMQRRFIPGTVGLNSDQKPWANVGKMESKGLDGTASFTQDIGKVNITLRGNLTYSTSRVLEYDEAPEMEAYRQTKGYKWGQTRGLIALGLFESQQDIDNSPIHTFGPVMPGDIKYKDVNGDGKINDMDYVPIGNTTIPGIVYGTGLSVRWKGIDFSFLLQGSGNCDFFLGGIGAYPFIGRDAGNVLTYVTEESNRWIPKEVSGRAETENPNALFPRLTYGNNQNNNRASTFWLRNSRYLRLKNVEIGYTFPKKMVRKLLMENARIYFLGNNLLVWDSFGWWDPELAKDNGAKYPIQKNFTLGLTVNF